MTAIRRVMTAAILLAIFLPPQAARADLNPNLSISPNPLIFDSVAPGGTSGPETLTVSNARAGMQNITISGVGVSNDVNFQITSDGCTGQTLSPGGTCDVAATFTPTGGIGGYFSGFGVLVSDEPAAVSVLSGEAVAPIVTLIPTSVDFGNQTVGSSSFPSEVIMKNSGNAGLAITSITTSAPFSVTDDCGATLGPGSRCTISQTFAPTAAGTASGSVSIVTDATTSPDSIPLSGTGIAAGQPDASFSTGALDFGGQVVNTTSGAQGIEMKNTGTVNLAVTSITPPAGFATSDDCGNQLAPEASCTIDATFNPTEAQEYSGNLVVVTDAADSPHNIALTGFGSLADGPSAQFSQTSIDFGEQRLRTPSSPQTTTITSVGSEALTIDSIAKTADSTGSFSGEDSCSGKTLSPGSDCTVNVVFNPQEKGTLGATAEVSDNSSASPHTLIATGIGVRVSGGNCSLAGADANPLALHMLLASIAALASKRKRS